MGTVSGCKLKGVNAGFSELVLVVQIGMGISMEGQRPSPDYLCRLHWNEAPMSSIQGAQV